MEEQPLSLSTKVQPPFDAMSTRFLELWYPGSFLLPSLLAGQLMGLGEPD